MLLIKVVFITIFDNSLKILDYCLHILQIITLQYRWSKIQAENAMELIRKENTSCIYK